MNEDRMHRQKVILRLADAIAAMPSPFVTSGSVQLDQPPAIRFADGSTVELRESRDMVDALEEIAPLLERGTPAGFGDGRKTHVDAKVRRALQIHAKDGSFELLHFDPAASGVLEAVRAALTPDVPTPPRARLYAINVYTEGGHFASHKDTPRATDMLGTLVVCLPTPFRGGRLGFARGHEETSVDWASLPSRADDPKHLEWTAFFGDVDHSIDLVTRGARVTVTWILRSAEAGSAPDAVVTDGAALEGIVRALREAVDDADVVPPGGAVRIPCAHLYPVPYDDAERPMHTRIEPSTVAGLKGRDQRLARAALGEGFDVSLVPYLTDREQSTLWPLQRALPRRTIARLPSQLSSEDLEEIVSPEEPAQGIVYVPIEHGAAEYLFTREFSPTGYFGNEGGEFAFYAVSMLDVRRAGKADVPVDRYVTHGKFGRGAVIGPVPGREEPALRVLFDDGTERVILERFLRPDNAER